MTTYTAEDFANAVFARHPDGRIAARVDSGNLGWWAGGNERAEPSWRDDYEMAEEGFVPVREAQPITLDALQAAWEGAEQAEEYKAGDEAIVRYKADDFGVVKISADRVVTTGRFRLLHRAPKPARPEGAEAIEEALLKEWLFDLTPEVVADLADRLARRGVRVTEEGDDR